MKKVRETIFDAKDFRKQRVSNMQTLRATSQVKNLLNSLLSHGHDHAMRITHG